MPKNSKRSPEVEFPLHASRNYYTRL